MTHQIVEPPLLRRPAPSATDHRPRDLPIFFVATFAITWGLAAVALFAPDVIVMVTGRQFDTTNPAYFAAVYSPSMVGIAMIASRSGFAGLGDLVGRLFRWRVHPGYYVLLFGGWLAMDLVARYLQVAVSGESETSSGFSIWAFLLHGTPPTPIEFWFAAPLFLIATLMLDAGPVGEEIGWKGYALPRLLDSKRGPLFAAIVFGLIWGIWHAPAFLISGTAQTGLINGFLWLLAGTTFTSVIMTWLYQRTNGSILVAGILVHAMNNSMVSQLWAVVVVLSVPAALAGISLYRAGREATA